MKNQSSTNKSLLLLTVLGTSLSSTTIPLPYEEYCLSSSVKIKYDMATDPYENLMKQVDESHLLWQDNDDEKINSIIAFVEKIASQSKDIDSEFVEIVNENFWDLI